MRVLVVEPERRPEEREIDGSLKTMQGIVGGWIQPVYPFDEPVALVCNDEGKIMNLPANRGLRDKNGNKVLRTVKGRTHFISCAYFCCLAVENDVGQDEINRILTEFFSGHPSKSPEYNHTVSAGSAKPASVQTRRNIMRSLLPVADDEEPNPEESEETDFDDMDDAEQFKEEDYAV